MAYAHVWHTPTEFYNNDHDGDLHMNDKPEKMDLRSMDVSAENRAKLKQLFPSVFAETRNDKGELVESIDFEKLKAELGAFTDLFEGRRERYGMDWPGKKDCMKLIQQPSIGTLKPCREESVNFDATENLFIEGDNLEVLKLLQKSYYGKVKMIYIDPPYNTGKEFIYPDNYAESLDTYLAYAGLTDDEGKKFSTNTPNEGRFHTKWLNMMYPRLYLARNLLREDGVIVIHIDEHEYANLDKLLCEIFGEENNLGTIIWDKRNPKGDAKGISYQHEQIILFAKNKDVFNDKCLFMRPKSNAKKMLQKVEQLIRNHSGFTDLVRNEYKEWLRNQDFSGGEKAYSLIDDKGEIYRPVSMAWPNKEKAPNDYFLPLIHPITGKKCPVPERGWRNPSTTMNKLQKEGLILFGIDEKTQPNRKYLLKENLEENVPSLLYFGGSDDDLFKSLGITFDNPKVVEVAKKLLQPIARNSDIILDFFAGSCTTAHAVFSQNIEVGGNRKFIMVQLPEPCDEDSEALVGYKTIADIGKERIRRVIKKIEYEQTVKAKENAGKLPGMAEELPKLDLGFKVFKLDKSNFKLWDGSNPDVSEEKLAKQLELHIDHINPSATQEDVLYELLLKAGFKPTEKVVKKQLVGPGVGDTQKGVGDTQKGVCDTPLPGKTVYSISDGALLICLENDITRELIDAVAEAEPIQFICLDQAFKGNDQLKANAVQTFEARNQGRDKARQIVFRTV